MCKRWFTRIDVCWSPYCSNFLPNSLLTAFSPYQKCGILTSELLAERMKPLEKDPLTIIEQAEDHFIERIAENMHAFGMPSTVGRVLGIIYMNRKPMTLTELSESTGMSKTRMSQVVREMLDANIAEKVFEKGVRKDLYEVEQDYYQTFITLFSATWSKVVSKNKMMHKNSIGSCLACWMKSLLLKRKKSEWTAERIKGMAWLL